MKSPLVCLLLVLSAVSVRPAENVPSPATPATFRLISAADSHRDLFYDLSVDGKIKPVGVSLDQTLSRPYVLPDRPVLELYRMLSAPVGSPPGAKAVRQTVVTANMSSIHSSCIVVTLPAPPNQQAPLLPRIVADDPAVHRAGTLRVINCSKYNLTVSLDDRKTILATGANTLVAEESGRVLFQVAVKKGDEWEPAFTGERRLNASHRGYLFIFDYTPRPDGGSDAIPPPVLVRTFFEIAPGAAPQ